MFDYSSDALSLSMMKLFTEVNFDKFKKILLNADSVVPAVMNYPFIRPINAMERVFSVANAFQINYIQNMNNIEDE